MNENNYANKKNCCPIQIKSEVQPLNEVDAVELKELFKILASDTRLQLLHTLARVEEMCVCDLARVVDMTPQAISNQLRRLSERKIVTTRRGGNMIYYRIIDHCFVELLQKAMCLIDEK